MLGLMLVELVMMGGLDDGFMTLMSCISFLARIFVLLIPSCFPFLRSGELSPRRNSMSSHSSRQEERFLPVIAGIAR